MYNPSVNQTQLPSPHPTTAALVAPGVMRYNISKLFELMENMNSNKFYLSCKRSHVCPSCHQKRVVEFGERFCMEVLKKITHQHFVFSIPKIL